MILDNIAIPIEKPEIGDEVFPMDIDKVFTYYPNYLRAGGKRSPQEYLMIIIGYVGNTSALRDIILNDYVKYKRFAFLNLLDEYMVLHDHYTKGEVT